MRYLSAFNSLDSPNSRVSLQTGKENINTSDAQKYPSHNPRQILEIPVMKKPHLGSWFSGFTHMSLWQQEEEMLHFNPENDHLLVENYIWRTYSRSRWANKSRSSRLSCRTFVTSRALKNKNINKTEMRIALFFI